MVVRVDPSSEAVVQAFSDYQRDQRGLAERTVYNSAFIVRQFLAWRAEAGAGALSELRCEELGDFIVHEARRLKPRGMPVVASTVRTFVRFLFLSGVTTRDLSGSVPSAKTTRFGALPAAVDPVVLRALLQSCDRTKAMGRRDYAIFLLMARLGLRANEIAKMRLEDLDWRAGELVVRSKGSRFDRLPLPQDVGEAIVDYLRQSRPSSESREVFLHLRGAPVGMSRNAVVFVSRRASKRAGIAVVAGHRLRHTAATELLRQGASMREVGQVLRQDHSTTSAIYAKVDRVALSAAVRPWSEGSGQ
jgi:integrase/recombinase XerD